tara:strand:+ start:845 stop:1780 length:936 start_codon:yes stop_codon:yes gene_type:complete
MANDFMQISDMVADALDVSDAEISDLLDSAPLVAALPMEESSNGSTHKFSKETGAPVVGWRAENAGRDFDSSADTIVTATLKILDFSWQVDKAVADAWRKGRENFVAREGLRHLKAALFSYEKQLIGGTVNGDASGFAGLADSTGLDAAADDMVVDAGGTTADTGSSVWGIRLGANDVTGVYKGDGPSLDLGETIVTNFVDGSSKNLPVYYTPACLWLGVQIGGARSVGRVASVTADAGAKLDDQNISDLISKFPAGAGPTHLVMSRRSLAQLQQSRTATSTTGAPAPFPQESFGVPIITTDGQIDTEALL